MRIALAQCDLRVGDAGGNARLLLTRAREAAAQGAELLVTPELALSGYPPEDLLLRRDFLDCCQQALEFLARETPLPILAGHPQQQEGRLYNAASLLRDGGVETLYHKRCLPNYQVFDEKRYFSAGARRGSFVLAGVRFGVLICEDIWCEDIAPQEYSAEEIRCMLVLNASPYHRGKPAERESLVHDRVRQSGVAMVYVNLVGGQDELVFDGASFAVDASGQLQARLPQFQECLALLDVKVEGGTACRILAPEPVPLLEDLEEVYGALVLGLRDYVEKNHFVGAVLGLSGGIDSALTLAIAADALGAERVHALLMPSRYTAPMSVEDALSEVNALGVRHAILPIDSLFDAYLEALAPIFSGTKADVTEENLQARIRAALLMAHSNKFGHLLISTGNKSEMAVGYATLYGDMAGGFALIRDCPKTLVYALARYRNRLGGVIPERVLERAPSAELAPGQKDQDSLPAYEVLDAILQAYVERGESAEDIAVQGISPTTVDRTLQMIQRAEYKRRQGAPGVRISPLAFGKDRRYPITNGFRPWAPECGQEKP